jgi:phospholipase/carboxylesterase/glyoxalase family protein
MTVNINDFAYRFEPGTSPSLLLLHGTGGNEHDLVGLGQAISPGATILSPRGRVLENGMPRFFRRLAEGVFDIEDLHARTAELAAWIEAVTAEHGIDQQPIVAIGFSNGANMAGSLLLSNPGLLAGAILLRPMVPFTPDAPPALNGTRVLISAGTDDELMSPDEAKRLDELFRSYGANVQLTWQQGGHGLMQSDLETAKQWFGSSDW